VPGEWRAAIGMHTPARVSRRVPHDDGRYLQALSGLQGLAAAVKACLRLPHAKDERVICVGMTIPS